MANNRSENRGVQLFHKPLEWPVIQAQSPCRRGCFPADSDPRLQNSAITRSLLAKLTLVRARTGDSQAFDDYAKHFSNDKTSICVTSEPNYLLSLLNSKVLWWFIRQTAASKQGGFYEFKPMYVSAIPIPVASAAEQAEMSGLVERILLAKRAGDAAAVKELEAAIETHVFRLYALTPEEIALVKSSTAKAR